MRSTKQRTAILHALQSVHRPLSAPELLEHAQQDVPGMGLATVYRAIDSLVKVGRITVVEIPGKPPRYEIAGKDHHHHFLCATCHKVFEVEGCPGNIDGLVPPGFTLEKHELTLYGTCKGCSLKPSTKSPRATLPTKPGPARAKPAARSKRPPTTR
jgi:Fur family ferric uptake transcriptional regulator